MIDNIVNASYTSVWDGGFFLTFSCKVNLDTKEVFDIAFHECDDEKIDFVCTLDREYVTINGEEFEVIPKKKMGVDYNGFWHE